MATVSPHSVPTTTLSRQELARASLRVNEKDGNDEPDEVEQVRTIFFTIHGLVGYVHHSRGP